MQKFAIVNFKILRHSKDGYNIWAHLVDRDCDEILVTTFSAMTCTLTKESAEHIAIDKVWPKTSNHAKREDYAQQEVRQWVHLFQK